MKLQEAELALANFYVDLAKVIPNRESVKNFNDFSEKVHSTYDMHSINMTASILAVEEGSGYVLQICFEDACIQAVLK